MVFHGGISLKKLEKILLAAALAAAVFVCGGCKKTASTDEIKIETGNENLGNPDNLNETGLPQMDDQEIGPREIDLNKTDQETETLIYVHVCGQVKEPGVYSLKEGSRLYEAIEMAGGVTENGVCDALNLAVVLEDGMRIMVPDTEQAKQWVDTENAPAGSLGMTVKDTSDAGTAGKVNLNRASVQELMTLNGIGQSRAEAIVRYREEIGSFQTIEDVMNVSGIKENAFNKIKDNITV